ncbi:unnamed protein product [Rotaria magnacalcarata]|uniref:Uncharacterized protein n=1 Tax=Rotaria magnacalcarata TaxID=392030 RepID=A0A820CAZ6_9BILA|nr:unnamed protein product [Rotaria magnacalcarata]CAF4204532.1 unnamed protein product [Rotaria magnacalcarata]
MTKHSRIILAVIVSIFIGIAYHINAFPTIIRKSHSSLVERNLLSDFKQSSSLLKIAIIGSSGYIGSRLLHYLQERENLKVVGYDRIYAEQASHEISAKDLQKFQVVIYLGGLTDRILCRDHPKDAEKENVKDIYDLAIRMLPSQILIFASTSEVAEGFGSIPLNETTPVQSHLFDTYVNSMMRREDTLQKLSLESDFAPRMIGLRLGIVIGLSSSQRVDLGHIFHVCQAFLGGKLYIDYPEAYQSFLTMEDLLRAINIMLKRKKTAKRFDLFHLESFSVSISKMANAIASRLGARVIISNYSMNKFSRGFSLNTTKFRSTYRFVFNGNQNQLISMLIENVPRLCVGRQSRVDNDSVPCVVCGSREMHTVLDLHSQPLANDFRKQSDDALKCERFPLRLVRCPKCYHTQLSYIVDRAYLFSHYLYQSGTSKSIQIYFAWLAEKIITESSKANGTILEIASNDGTQLTEFAKRGWKTVGVDPAKNLADLARAKGHTVHVGFWGADKFPHLPSPETLDAIVAQNVAAHVGNPVEFMRACVAVMGTRTKLYIQTSQCEMYETGQFDTVYHEHISFFTAHSFKKMASLAGLQIVNFEITPIHGRSCLVTFQRIKLLNNTLTLSNSDLAPSLMVAIQKERNLGLTDAWFYVKYQAQAHFMRQWIVHQLTNLYAQGHVVIGYGAAAKGMVLLHSLLEMKSKTWLFSYIIDDAPLKQNTYCPGTSIPVRPTTELSKHNVTQPLTIVILAWNFWEEIVSRIQIEILKKEIKNVFVMLPFPEQQLIQINSNSNTIVTKNAFKLLSWPLPFPSVRRPVLLISHLYNETTLLPSWIRHHAPMFDRAILINYDTTNRSLKIVQNEAPNTWKVISSQHGNSDSQGISEAIRSYGKIYAKAWKIVLTIDELLVHTNPREMLAETERTSDVMALRFPLLTMIRSSSIPFDDFTSILNHHTLYIANLSIVDKHDSLIEAYRCIHRHPDAGCTDDQHNIKKNDWQWAPLGFIANYRYTISFRHTKDQSQTFPYEIADSPNTQERLQHNFDLAQFTQNKKKIRSLRVDDLQNVETTNDALRRAHRLWREMTNH